MGMGRQPKQGVSEHFQAELNYSDGTISTQDCPESPKAFRQSDEFAHA
jgi:hypothetical protein